MVIEKILFPAPNPPHYTLSSHGTHLFWLPAGSDSVRMPKIPCMLYSPPYGAKFFMIWCHGNGCDIGSMHILLKALSRRLDSHVLIFEFPSYGLCQGPTESNRETIDNHAERAYSFVHETLHWPTNRILIYGHSIGSGTACHIASKKPIGGLILQSPYISIGNLIREKIGFLGLLFGGSYWDNLKAMKYIHCPTLFIHGQRDNLIPPQHSQTLHDSLAHVENKQLILLSNDDHNSISDAVILTSVELFLAEFFPPPSKPLPRVEIDPDLRVPPTPVESSSSASSYSMFTSLLEVSRASTNATRSAFNSVFSNESQNNDD
jgi:pimeloyl-ACP methyl ester carboxylesterase